MPVRERPADEPRTVTELLVQDLFARSLGRTGVGLHERFFEAGGTSLTAVHLIAQIRRRTGVRLHLQDVLELGTPENIAAAVAAGETRSSRCLVELSTTASVTDLALVAVHPLGGGVMWYRFIAAALADRLPTTGIQAVGLDPDAAPDRSIEAMASRYVDEISSTSVRPVLLGYSFGGLVAYEMARILRARGREVAGVLMLDTALATKPQPPSSRARLLWSLVGHALGVRINVDALAAMDDDEMVRTLLAAGKAQGSLVPDYSAQQLARLVSLYPVNAEAERRFVPRPYDGRVDLARVEGGRVSDEVIDLWRGVAPDTHVHPLSGDHLDLLSEENAPVVAALIEQIWLDASGTS